MQSQGSLVVLDSVAYGEQGPWAVNTWFKVSSVTGSSYEYLYSHASTSQDPSEFGPNQVWCLLDSPLCMHPCTLCLAIMSGCQ